MDRQQTNLVIIVVLVAFLIAVSIGTFVAIRLLRPAASPTGGAPVITTTSAPPITTTSPYVTRAPNDNAFSAEVPPGFYFIDRTHGMEQTPEGKSIAVRRYIAGGGKDAIDGFAVVRFVEYLDNRPGDQTADSFVAQLLDRYLTGRGCSAGVHDRVQRKINECVHVEGSGVEPGTNKPYFMALEAFTTNNDIVVLLVAGYQKSMLTDPATDHFFDTFALTGQE